MSINIFTLEGTMMKRLGVLMVGLVLVGLVTALAAGVALATCSPSDTGGSGNDTITCNDGTIGSTIVLGDGGDDSITVETGTGVDLVSGDNFPGLTGGNDTIIINGSASRVQGDSDGEGGDDEIVINGTVGGNVDGDFTNGDGGNDTITISGTVGGAVYGDDVGSNGGDDTIIISGSVGGDVAGDDGIGLSGGDDYVELQDGATIGGTIYGNGGTDTLSFRFSVAACDYSALAKTISQNASSGSMTINGNTYDWDGFEELSDLLQVVGQCGGGGQIATARYIDPRLNIADIGFAPIAVYCGGDGQVKVLNIVDDGEGQEAFNSAVLDGLLQAADTGENVLIVENMGSSLWALPGNLLQTNSGAYSFQFDGGRCAGE
jgi:hypothetical protein